MATKITQDKIQQINELYLKYKTYAAVAREIGCAPTTVKKYIIKDYTPIEQIQVIKFDKSKIKEVNFELFKNIKNWGDLCTLSLEEEEEIKQLQKEVII